MTLFSTPMTASHSQFSRTAAAKTNSLPMNPAVDGKPMSDRKKATMTMARKGARLPSPA